MRAFLAVVVLVATSAWAQDDAPVAPAPAPPPIETPKPTVETPEAKPDMQGETTAPAPSVTPRAWTQYVDFSGYAKTGFSYIQTTTDDALIGSRNGFRLLNVRLSFGIKPVDSFKIVASIDGAVGRRNEADPLDGNRVVELRDGYAEWSPRKYALLRAGQFKAPFNAETLLGDAVLPFINRSVMSEGIRPPEGFAREGLSLDRQVGVQVSSERLGSDTVGVRYAAALVNGNGPNVLANDNNSVAPVGRVMLELKDVVSIGANAYWNPATQGFRPNRIHITQLGYGGDVAVHVGNFDALINVLQRRTTNPTTGLPPETGFGYMGSVHYWHEGTGIEAGVRYAKYDPSNVEPDDGISEITALIGYHVAAFPVRLLLQGTLRSEDPGVEIANNGIDALVQVNW